MESTIGSLIDSAEGGDRSAADALFAALYSELHGLAQRQLARSGVTLGVTTLLHEAYLAISSRDRVVFPDRARFMGYAARVMRGLIIDYARSRQALKRGGAFEITSLVDEARTPRRTRGIWPGSATRSTNWARSIRRWRRWST